MRHDRRDPGGDLHGACGLHAVLAVKRSTLFSGAASGFLLLAAATPASWAQATSQPIDDSGTMVEMPTLPLVWSPQRGGSYGGLVTASTRVNLVLHLDSWLSREGRIYMVLPRGNGTPVRARWAGAGHLLAGELVSGQRALVYTGPITAPLLEDSMLMTIEADPRHLAQAQALQFGFEIEVGT